MATAEEKEELIATLKFTPRTYRVEITGRGGEVYWGSVDRKIYDFFKEHKIDIEQYAGDWDEEKWAFIPDDLKPFWPGSAYDIGGVHESGATFDDSSYITVYDENGDELWSSALGTEALEKIGVEVSPYGEEYISEQYAAGTPVFYGAQGKKGLFFGAELYLTQPFDPANLTVSYGDYNGWELVTGVAYDETYLDSNDYDTSGKWSDAKWIIVGDTEEVYEGEYREDADSDE